MHTAESKAGGVIFLFAFLADKQQGLVAGVKVGVFHRFLDELGLAAFQLTDKQVNRDLFCHSRRSFR